jgi:hypothetical protein
MLKKERLAQAVEIGPFARATVEQIAHAAQALATEPTEEHAEKLIALMKTLEHTAVGLRWV